MAGPTLRISDSLGLEQGLRICISRGSQWLLMLLGQAIPGEPLLEISHGLTFRLFDYWLKFLWCLKQPGFLSLPQNSNLKASTASTSMQQSICSKRVLRKPLEIQFTLCRLQTRLMIYECIYRYRDTVVKTHSIKITLLNIFKRMVQ